MIGGKLRFKGMKPLAPAKRLKTEAKTEVIEEIESPAPTIQDGEGKILSSRQVIHGSKTNFEKYLAPGDLLIAEIEGKNEQRKITMVLGRKSLSIQEPFSKDLSEKSKFKFLKLTRPKETKIEEET
jgi:hypothetical protein